VDIALSVKDIHKEFILPHERHSSLKAVLMRTRDRGYEMQHVLRGVSFDIPKGEFFGIVGRNGSGKSTLLKILAGIYQPTSGTVERDGSLVPLIELGVGFNPELSARDNVYLNGAMVGFSRRQVDGMYDDIVEFAGLSQFMDQKLKNYSSGMQVRLAFSIATRTKADILLLDEVLAVGDADFQRKCLAYFHDLKQSGATVIFVSHSMDSVREFCDRAVLLEQGELVAAGTADEVAQAYTRLFSPPPEPESEGADGQRFGTGDVRFEHAEVSPEFTETDDDIAITARLSPRAGFDRRVRLGVLIRTAEGTHVLGSNSATATEARAFEAEVTGSTDIHWHVPNILNDGDYSVTLIAADAASHEILEQWDEAAHFSVRREPRTTNLMAPSISLAVVPVG